MKKIVAITTALLLLLGTLSLTGFAEASDSIRVYVTIADKNGNLALAQEAVTVSDSDGDGALTINDALYAAHEAKYQGGAAAGYASSYGNYGLSLDKLWGTANGGSYGYYVNNASAWSLADPVEEDDYIAAFVYTDLESWSDTYCYFDANTVSGQADETITLTLSAEGYDADWNPVVLPVENAVITVNGEKTAYTTDAEGKVTFSLAEAGSYVISAVSEDMVLVPPVCLASVAASASEPDTSTTDADTDTTTTTADTTQTTQTIAAVDAADTTGATDIDNAAGTGSAETSPQTGDTAHAVSILTLLAAVAGMVAFSAKRRPLHEK